MREQYALRHADHLAKLLDAVDGVELTGRDRALLDWLAQWDPETVEALTGLVARLREAGR
jgi:hypothetical protein